MSLEAIRQRGTNYSSPAPPLSPSLASVPHTVSWGSPHQRLERTLGGGRALRGFVWLLAIATFFFFLCIVILIQTQGWDRGWYGKSVAVLQGSQRFDDSRRHLHCPVTEALVVPARRSDEEPLEVTYALLSKASSMTSSSQSFAYESEVIGRNGDFVGGKLNTVAALLAYCSERVADIPSWRTASWQQTGASNRSAFDVPVSLAYLPNTSYTAIGSPVCLREGRIYMTEARIRAGIADVQAAGLTVFSLTDDWLSSASLDTAGTELRVMPAMAILIHGLWIATHGVHLITDALEALHCAYQSWQSGVLLRIPTQTVLLHQPELSWADRHGDISAKMELSAALANAFSSPVLGRGSPYNSSFLFRLHSRHCAEMGTNVAATVASPLVSPPPASRQSAARPSTVCFCDGLLATTHRLPFLDPNVFYTLQDWVARQFRASPYGENRSVEAMERLQTRHASLLLGSKMWESSGDAASPSWSAYQPRVLFVHRTTRLIANASRYACWMREAGFRVEEVYLEHYTAPQQYYMGRYADVVVGMHGLGIIHAMWMERSPPRCRTVIEFRPWVIASSLTYPALILKRALQYNFIAIPPIDVRFGSSIADPVGERKLLLSPARMVDAFRYPSFTDQTAIYDDDKVKEVIANVYQHLQRCLPP